MKIIRTHFTEEEISLTKVPQQKQKGWGGGVGREAHKGAMSLSLQTYITLPVLSPLSAMQKGAKTMGIQRDNLLGMGKGVTKGFKEVNI